MPQLVNLFKASRCTDVSETFVKKCTKMYNDEVKSLYNELLKEALLAPKTEVRKCIHVIVSCGPEWTEEMVLARCEEECTTPLVWKIVKKLVSGCFTRDEDGELPNRVTKDERYSNCDANLGKAVKEQLFGLEQTKSKYALQMFFLLFQLFLDGKSCPAEHATTADLLDKYPEFSPLGQPELDLLRDYWFYMAAGVDMFGVGKHKDMLLFIVARLAKGKEAKELITGSGQSAECDCLVLIYQRESFINREKPFQLRSFKAAAATAGVPLKNIKRKQVAVVDDSSICTDSDSSVSSKRSRSDSSASAATMESIPSFDEADDDLAAGLDACSFAHADASGDHNVSVDLRAASVPLFEEDGIGIDAALDELLDDLGELVDEQGQDMVESMVVQSTIEPDLSGCELCDFEVPRDFIANADMSGFNWEK